MSCSTGRSRDHARRQASRRRAVELETAPRAPAPPPAGWTRPGRPASSIAAPRRRPRPRRREKGSDRGHLLDPRDRPPSGEPALGGEPRGSSDPDRPWAATLRHRVTGRPSSPAARSGRRLHRAGLRAHPGRDRSSRAARARSASSPSIAPVSSSAVQVYGASRHPNRARRPAGRCRTDPRTGGERSSACRSRGSPSSCCCRRA